MNESVIRQPVIGTPRMMLRWVMTSDGLRMHWSTPPAEPPMPSELLAKAATLSANPQ